MNLLKDISLKNKKVLVRVDFNVPLNKKKEVADNTRIFAVKPTTDYILKNQGICILMTHFGRPEGRSIDFSIEHILGEVQKTLNRDVVFVNDCIGPKVKKAAESLKAGQILLLENLRFYKQETQGEEAFSKNLADIADVYVNDAFGTSHRRHASTAVVAKYFKEKCAGLLLEQETKAITQFLESKQHPVTAIIGGAKVSSKIPVIKSLLSAVDNLLIGGGMAYTFIKSKGGHIGESIFERDMLAVCNELLKEAADKGVLLLLPEDVIAAERLDNNAQIKTLNASNIKNGWMGLDIGEKTQKTFNKIINDSKTILWNGPLGVFEMDSFSTGTKAVADAVVETTKKGGFSLVGGGDSVAALKKFNLVDKVSYVSTGGGAMLESLEGKALPGIVALSK